MKARADGQMSGLAGEFFVAAELLKRGLQTSITFGNAKSIDLLAWRPNSDRRFSIQVKALRAKNFFPIKFKSVEREHIYAFVLLNKPDQPVEYFIVPGIVLRDQCEKFGKDFLHPTFPGIHPRSLEAFRNKWSVFD